MATYFDGTAEIQGDGLQQTLYLMNPSYVGGYSDAPAQANMASFMINSANGQQHFAASNSVVARPQQGGLSLRPSWQQAPFSAGGDEAKIVASSSPSPSAAASNGSLFTGSKYLKAAQQLLDEVVNVGNGGKVVEQMATKHDKDAEGAGGEGNSSGCGGSAAKRGVQLTTGERQELQITKGKLVNMLDEVEQRYGQYHHQMQTVASSLEAVAGIGSARNYTALALKTMSKQFKCLRDAISGQIRATDKSPGEEEDCLGGRNKSVGGSRLRYVDHHLRQQRALQQLGMAEYNTWRPQRGLPDRAVSVLRAWLFEHFLHPYPKDSDKHMLAKETGLTRSQVSNWFINARVRLWKPMVEEMYMEENKEQEQNAGGDDQKSEGSEHSLSNQGGQSPTRTDQTDSFRRNQDNHPMSHHEMRQQEEEEEEEEEDMSNRERMMKFTDHGGGFGESYQIGQFDHEQYAPPRFGGNGVSLTLGLPHCESMSLSGSQRATYLSSHSNIPLERRLDIGMGSEEVNYFSLSSSNNNNSGNNASASHPPNDMYESINIQNRKRFAAQLIPDYVA